MAGLIINGMVAEKRINSTSTAYEMPTALKFENVLLKANTSIVDPVFIMQKPVVTAIHKTMNYLYCEDFDRYYWVKDIINQAGRSGGSSYFIEIHCHEDVLGSWHSVIGAMPCFVRYCSDTAWTAPHASSGPSSQVVQWSQDDDRLSAEFPVNGFVTSLLSDKIAGYINDYLTYSAAEPMFAITIGQMGIGATTSSIYVLTKYQFRKFWQDLYTQSGYTVANVDSVDKFIKWSSEKLGGIPLDPSCWIQDIRMLPFTYSAIGAAGGIVSSKITMGLIEVDASETSSGSGDATCYWFEGHTGYLTDIYDIDLKISGLGAPVASGTNYSFLRRKKYLKLTLSTPFGELDISSDSFAISTTKVTVTVKVALEVTSGDIGMHVFCKDTGELLGKVTGNISYNMSHLINKGGSGEASVSGKVRGATSIISALAPVAGAGIGYAAGGAGGAVKGAGIGAAAGHAIGSLGSLASTTIQGAVSDGGSIIATSNSWIDTILQGLEKDSQALVPKNKVNVNSLFKVIATVFVPNVCGSETTYQAYGALMGYPCNRMVKDFTGLSNNGSFIQCSQFDIKNSAASSSMYPEEMEEINQYLNTGIYWDTSKYSPPGKKNKDDVAEKASL